MKKTDNCQNRRCKRGRRKKEKNLTSVGKRGKERLEIN